MTVGSVQRHFRTECVAAKFKLIDPRSARRIGKLRALTTASLKKVDMLPDVPTVESGYKDLQLENWFSVVASTLPIDVRVAREKNPGDSGVQ